MLKKCNLKIWNYDILFQIIWKKNLKPFLVLNPMFFSCLICFEWSKNLWVCWLGIDNTSLYYKCNKTMTKECNLKIWNCNILFQMFWKKIFKPFLISNPISFSFLVHFDWSKNLKVCQVGIYKTSLNSKCNKTMMKEFNFKIQNYFNMSITKHELPLHKTTHIFFVLWPNWTFFCSIGSSRWKATNVFSTTTKKEQCVRSWHLLKS
jgi:hypothetical protein